MWNQPISWWMNEEFSVPGGSQLLETLLTVPASQGFEFLEHRMLMIIILVPLYQASLMSHHPTCVYKMLRWTNRLSSYRSEGSLGATTLNLSLHCTSRSHLSAKPPAKSPSNYRAGSRWALEIALTRALGQRSTWGSRMGLLDQPLVESGCWEPWRVTRTYMEGAGTNSVFFTGPLS